MSFLGSNLIDDCITIIFQFLPLRDVLSYGATSIRNLEEVDPYLDQIRQQVVENTLLRRSVSTLVQVLESPLSVSCHLQDTVRSLLSALPTAGNAVVANTSNLNCHTNSAHVANTGQVASSLSRQRDNLRFHKICKKIISGVMSIDHWVNEIKTINNRTNEIPLNRYIGNIICATCLLGHRIHGSPTELDWIQMVEKKLYVSSIVIESSAWYSLWAMLHSMVLRTVPLLEDQLLLLGIDRQELHANIGSSEQKDSRGLFCSPSSSIIRATVALLETISFKHKQINFRINDFGPLGAFRGRDRLRHVTLDIDEISVLLQIMIPETNSCENAYSEVIRPMLSSFFDVQSQVFKSQPMTVAPPVVILSKCFIQIWDSPTLYP